MDNETQIKVSIRMFLQQSFKECSENNRKILIDALTEPLCNDMLKSCGSKQKISMKDVEEALVRYICKRNTANAEENNKHVTLTHPRCTALKPFK